MKYLPKTLVYILSIIILASSFAAAQNQPFAVYTEKNSLEACSCQILSDSFTVYNTGEDEWYRIDSQSSFIEIGQPIVFAAKGGSAKVDYIISIPCGTKNQETEIEFTVTSLSGAKQTFSKQLKIGSCQNLKAALVPHIGENESIKPCTVVNYNLYIQNTGPFDDEYTYFADGKEQESFVLKPFEIKNISINYRPDCSIYGSHNAKFEVKTKGTNLRAVINHNLEIEQDYGFSMWFAGHEDSQAEFCQETSGLLSFVIRNDADTPNNYTLQVSKPGFIGDFSGTVSLNGKEQKQFDVAVSPANNQGEYKIAVFAGTEIGKASANASLSLATKLCYDIGISVDSSAQNILSCNSKDFVQAEIRNNAQQGQELLLVVDGADFADIEPQTIFLGPGESKTVNITIENPRDDQKHYIWIKAILDNWELDAVPIEYKGVSEYSCTLLEMQKKDVAINYQNFEKQITISNKGLQYEKYSIEFEGPEWARFSEYEIELFAGETRKLAIEFEDHSQIPEGSYPVVFIFFAETTGHQYEYSLNIVLKDKSGFEKAFEAIVKFFKFNPATTTMFFLICILIIVIVVLIAVKATAPKYPYKVSAKVKKYQTLLILLIALFVVTAALVFGLGGLPFIPQPENYVTPTEESNILQWAEDTDYYFNISEHVEDPDMDLLEYSVSPAEHIISSIEEDTIIFSPEKDWFGEETVMFTATDAFGQSTTSQPITLRVVDVPEFVFWDYIKPWFWAINLIIFLLILAVFFFIFVVHNRRKKKQ